MENNCKIQCESTDLIFVPKSFAKKYKKAKDENTQLKILEEILEKQKRDIKMDLENLEYDETQFRASILRYKKSFKEIYEHNAEQVSKLWDDIQKNKPDTKSFIDQLKNDLKPIITQIEQLSKFIEKINTYHLARMVELIDKVNSCDDKTKELLLKLIMIDKEDNKNV